MDFGIYYYSPKKGTETIKRTPNTLLDTVRSIWNTGNDELLANEHSVATRNMFDQSTFWMEKFSSSQWRSQNIDPQGARLKEFVFYLKKKKKSITNIKKYN
jgi:hypothetical protein